MGRSPVVEREVLDRARSGDHDALSTVWRTYHPQLLRFLRSCGSVAPDDVAAQVWVDVGRSIKRFDGDGRDFQRWVFTIARRRDIDEGRRTARRREYPSERVAHTEVPAVDRAEDQLGMDAAIALVASLPRQMAEAILLRVVHDLDVADAAEIMGTSEGNVRVLVHRGLTKLRQRMSELGTTPADNPGVRSSRAGVEIAAASAEISENLL